MGKEESLLMPEIMEWQYFFNDMDNNINVISYHHGSRQNSINLYYMSKECYSLYENEKNSNFLKLFF